MTSLDFTTCSLEAFVAEVTAQAGSLQEAASSNELFIQQVEGYLNRMREAMCSDLQLILENCCDGGGGATDFLGLTDTPASYAGAAGEVATVNAGETGLEFTVVAGGGLPDLVAGVEVASGRQVLGNDSYFKLIDCGAAPNATVKFVAHGLSAPYRIISCFGMMKNPTTNDQRPLPFVSHSNANNQMLLSTTSTSIELRTNSNFSAWTSSHVILEYIKVA